MLAIANPKLQETQVMSGGSDELGHEGHSKAHRCKWGFCSLVKWPGPG